MPQFKSVKVYDGFSTCFRQWRATGTHCSFLHGYAVSFKVTFVGDLDERNWVFDFGGMKRAKNKIDEMQPDVWIKWLLDHTVIVAEDDPYLSEFKKMNNDGIIQLRTLPLVGAERFAEYLFGKLNDFVQDETFGKVRVYELEFMEHGKNSATYRDFEAR